MNGKVFIPLVAMMIGAALLMVGAGSAISNGITPQAIVCTAYVQSGSCAQPTAGTINSWAWSPSSSTARRYQHYVVAVNQCLPSYAYFKVQNVRANGTVINTKIGNYGACSLTHPLDSGGEYAYARCRIVSDGGGVSRAAVCATDWN